MCSLAVAEGASVDSASGSMFSLLPKSYRRIVKFMIYVIYFLTYKIRQKYKGKERSSGQLGDSIFYRNTVCMFTKFVKEMSSLRNVFFENV